MSTSRLLRAFLVLAAAMLLPVAGQATIHNVSIVNFAFTPPKTVVNFGDTVRWTLSVGIHSSTADGTSPKFWDSGLMSVGGTTYDQVFVLADGTGPFPYHCSQHFLSMFDTIFVAVPPCCLPGPNSWRGDVDQSGGNPALADLSKLISFLKNQPGHYVYPCADQANVDAIPASNSVPGLADLSKLISYLKNQPGHWVLLPCP